VEEGAYLLSALSFCVLSRRKTQMRRLETHDVFKFARLINKIGAKEALKDVVLSRDTIEDMTKESFGYDVLFALFDVATTEEAENEIYNFLAPLYEKTT
jgi:hypothetical protein